MRRFAAVIVFLFLGAQASEARPHWWKDYKNLLALGIVAGSSAAASHSAYNCRHRVSVERCDGGYAGFKGEAAIRAGFSLGMGALSIWGHQVGLREWTLPAAAATAWNIRTAVHDSRQQCRGTTLICD
jgi:hypothetical protein